MFIAIIRIQLVHKQSTSNAILDRVNSFQFFPDSVHSGFRKRPNPSGVCPSDSTSSPSLPGRRLHSGSFAIDQAGYSRDPTCLAMQMKLLLLYNQPMHDSAMIGPLSMATSMTASAHASSYRGKHLKPTWARSSPNATSLSKQSKSRRVSLILDVNGVSARYSAGGQARIGGNQLCYIAVS